MNRKLLKAETILTGKELNPLKGGAILVEDDKIARIYTTMDGVDTTGTEVVDYGSATLIPGMIDCHNHLALDARLENHLVKMNDCEAEQTIRAIQTMKDDLDAGVTTARCLGDRFYIDVTCRNAQRTGRISGPRLVVSGIGMRASHGHGYVGMPHCGAEEFRKTARENIGKGVDMLKVFMTKVINDKPFIYHFLTLAELRAVVEEAKSVNIPTAVHCSGGQGLDDCITAGIDCLEHVYYINERQVERVAKEDRWVCYTPSYFLNDTLLYKFSPLDQAGSQQEKAIITGCIQNAIQSGLKFAIGTDGLHQGLAQEACYIASLGADNRLVLSGITYNAARLCRVESKVGSLEEGKLADIVALQGNPLENMEHLKQVTSVIQGGTIIR